MCLDYIKMKLIVDTEKTKELSHDPTVQIPEIHSTAIRVQVNGDLCIDIKIYMAGSLLYTNIYICIFLIEGSYFIF